MLEVGAPLWILAALAAIPLVRWMHRLGASGAPVQVAALFLWRGQEENATPSASKRPPDPAWRRRAFAAACILLALASPVWRGSAAPEIVVWFDDTPSMTAQEDGVPRWRVAIEALTADLAESATARADIRSLTRPGLRVGVDAESSAAVRDALAAWINNTGGEAGLPNPELMSPDVEHWLVTDGAEEGMAGWISQAPIARVIRVGAGSENVAVSRLSARRSLLEPEELIVLVEVRNFGGASSLRRLTLDTGGRPVLEADLDLAAGEAVIEQVRIALPGAPLDAALAPLDSQPLDDRLRIADLASALSPSVHVGEACGRFIHSAAAAHPALRPASSATAADIRFACGPGVDPLGGMNIWFRDGAATRPVAATPTWDPAARQLQELQLQDAGLQVFDAPPLQPGQIALLSAGGVPLIVRHGEGAGPIEVRLDLGRSDLERRPELPALIAGLIDLDHGRPLLDGSLVVAHANDLSRIAPQELPQPTSGATWRVTPAAADLTPALIAAATLLVLLDAFLLFRRNLDGTR